MAMMNLDQLKKVYNSVVHGLAEALWIFQRFSDESTLQYNRTTTHYLPMHQLST